jgi:hypothetical protein
MASLLLDALRGLLLGEATDYAKEKAKPYVDEAMAAMRDPQQAITPGARMDDRGYPTMSEMLPAETAPYNQQGIEPANPRTLNEMMRGMAENYQAPVAGGTPYEPVPADRVMTAEEEARLAAYNPSQPIDYTDMDQRLEGQFRQNELDRQIGAENQSNILDFVRQAGEGMGTAETSPYTPSGDGSAMFQSIMDMPDDQIQISPQKAEQIQSAVKDDPEASSLVSTVLKDPKKAQQAFIGSQHAIEMSQQGEPEPGFFDKIGSALGNFFGDEETMLKLGMAFNQLQHNYKPEYDRIVGARISAIRTAKKAPIYAQKLRDMGYPQYADLVLANPEMSEDIMKQIIQKEMKPDLGQQSYAAKVDEATGRMYIQKFDPNTGKTSIEYLDGVKGQTAAEKTKMELDAKEKERDTKFAQDMSTTLIEKADNIGSQIRNLEEVDKQLAAGANTGTISNLFPTLRTSTLALQNAVNRLGLDVIGGTTFGALSAEELKMALRTAVPTDMNEDDLREWVREKIRVQRMLERELLNSARKLSGGMGWSEWIKERDEAAKAAQEAREAAAANEGQSGQPTKTVDDGLSPTAREMQKRGLL